MEFLIAVLLLVILGLDGLSSLIGKSVRAANERRTTNEHLAALPPEQQPRK